MIVSANLKSNESHGYYLAMQAMAIEVKGILFISKKDTVILGNAFSGINAKDRIKLNAQVLVPVSDTWYRLEPTKVYNLVHSESEMKELETALVHSESEMKELETDRL